MAITLAHAAKIWELYNSLAWTPTYFGVCIFSVLPSVCGIVGGLTAGTAADYILSKFCDDDQCIDIDEATEKRTQVRKLFQGIALLGPATCLYLLSNLPEQASTAQVLLGGTVGLLGVATQEKAGQKWAGLLYSLTSLPGVMVGSVCVSVTGQLLDMMADKNAGWSAVQSLS
jgi:MFS transporter, ACS family, solute carrier family 17 (sodium-dependent inorganic phosphate cotransporter), other